MPVALLDGWRLFALGAAAIDGLIHRAPSF